MQRGENSILLCVIVENDDGSIQKQPIVWCWAIDLSANCMFFHPVMLEINNLGN